MKYILCILSVLFMLGCSDWGTKENVKRNSKNLCDKPKITILHESGEESISKVTCPGAIYIMFCNTNKELEGCKYNKCAVVYRHKVK